MSSSFGTFGATFGNLGTGGGVLLPASPSEILQDLQFGLESDGLTLKDNKAGANVDEPELRNVNCLNFGLADCIETNSNQNYIQQTGIFEIGFWAKRSDTAASHRVLYPLFNAGSGNAGWRVQFQSGNDTLNFFVANNGATIVNKTFANTKDSTLWHFYQLIGDGVNVKFYVDGDLEDTSANITTGNLGGTQGRTTRISDSTLNMNGQLSGVYVSDGTSKSFHLYGEEGAGTTAFDVTSNGVVGNLLGGASWSTGDGISSVNARDGFYQTVTTPDANKTSFVIYGDSLTAQNGDGIEGSSTTALGRGYFNWMRTHLSSQVYLKSNEGVGSETSAQILLRVGDVIAEDPDYCIICAGRNDVTGSVSLSTTTSNLDDIESALAGAGIGTIWLTVTPSTGDDASQVQLLKDVNSHIKSSFSNVYDSYSVIDDGTGSPISGYTYDTLHWNNLGAAKVGAGLASIVEPLIDGVPYEWHDLTHDCNACTNPLFASSASGWSTANATRTLTSSVIHGGNEVLLTANSDGLAYVLFTEDIADGLFAVGDTIRIAAEIEWSLTDDTTGNYSRPFLRVQAKNGDTSTDAIHTALSGGTESVNTGPKPTSGSIVLMTTEYTVGALVETLSFFVGFEELRSGDTVSIKRFSAWNTTDAATEEYPKVPALDDGSGYDALGNALTNPAGYTHNVSECDVQQVDPQYDEFGASASFWGDGSSTWYEKTYAQIDAHYSSSNGSLGLWVKKIGENVCRMSQYSLTKNWTPGEVERNESYFGGGGAALRDVNGDLITDVNGYVIFAA